MAKKDTFWESIYKFKNKLMAVFTILVIFGSIIGYLSTQVTTLRRQGQSPVSAYTIGSNGIPVSLLKG